MATELNYNDFAVVAHDQWELNFPKDQASTIFSANLGGFRWLVTLAHQCVLKHLNYCSLTVDCVELKEETVSDEFHLELFIYGRHKEGDDYKLININKSAYGPPNASRTLFKHNNSSGSAQASASCHSFYYILDRSYEFVLLNVRILKDRPLLHDFTVDQPIGHLKNDLKLKVGEQIFHVNKKTLEVLSAYFHRMFNNPNFAEANQDVVDTGETDVALFHNFLLTNVPMTSGKHSALPNSKNLAGLLRLADYYEVDSLFGKLEHSLKLCREVPITERILLAKKCKGKTLNLAGILQEVTNLAAFRRTFLAIFDAVE